jgi:hypothetical protein
LFDSKRFWGTAEWKRLQGMAHFRALVLLLSIFILAPIALLFAKDPQSRVDPWLLFSAVGTLVLLVYFLVDSTPERAGLFPVRVYESELAIVEVRIFGLIRAERRIPIAEIERITFYRDRLTGHLLTFAVATRKKEFQMGKRPAVELKGLEATIRSTWPNLSKVETVG